MAIMSVRSQFLPYYTAVALAQLYNVTTDYILKILMREYLH